MASLALVAEVPRIQRVWLHHAEWIAACKNGGPTTCHFDYGGALTETKVAEAAAKYKVVTQMGTQIQASDNYRRVVELNAS